MTTCPRCGRVADEFVCADCGMSLALARRKAAVAQTGSGGTAAEPGAGLLDDLATEDDGAAAVVAGEVRMWRLGVLVCVTCLLAAATAIVLLRYGGNPHRSKGAVAQPTGSASATTRPTRSAPARSAASTQQPAPTRRASSHAAPSPMPRPSAKPVEVGARSSGGRSSAPPTTAPVRRTTAPSPSVHVARGGLDPRCGPHCYTVVVTLADFGSGTQHVTCWSGHEGAFSSYGTASAVSTGCSYRHPHDSVWVVVDGRYRSNTVTW